MPEFVAGLQFDAVVLGGCRAEFSKHLPNQGYTLRRFLSQLYLGCSRAAETLHIHVCAAGGGVPEVIESAVRKKLLEVSGSQEAG